MQAVQKTPLFRLQDEKFEGKVHDLDIFICTYWFFSSTKESSLPSTVTATSARDGNAGCEKEKTRLVHN